MTLDFVQKQISKLNYEWHLEKMKFFKRETFYHAALDRISHSETSTVGYSDEDNNLYEEEQELIIEGLNDYKVERFRRDATPVSVVLLALMGAVVASRKTRGGSGLHMAVGIILAALFVVMDKFSLTFSTKGNLHPFLAAWMPNIIFTIVAVFLYRRAPK